MTALPSSIAAVRVAARAATRIKATHIAAFDVSQPVVITDIMLVVTASNERQVLAIAEEMEKDVYLEAHLSPRSREGVEDARWVLLDFGDFVAHIMLDEAREYYALDTLWSDCPMIDLQLPEETQEQAALQEAHASQEERADAVGNPYVD